MAQLPDVPLDGLTIASGYLPGEVYAHMSVDGVEIGNRTGASRNRAQVDKVIHRVIDADDFSIHSTLKMTRKAMAPIKYEMAPMIRNAVGMLAGRRG